MSAGDIGVIQATAWYAPHHLGGTEVYLEGLVGELAAHGVESTIVVPRSAGAPDAYVHAATPVMTYPVNEVPAANEMRDGRPHLHFDAFRGLLKERRDAVYHQHSWSRGCGPHHLRAARDLGLRTVLTVHVPGNICLRGTMLRFGSGACDGRVEERTCGACWAEGRGMPELLAKPVAGLPLGLARKARRTRSRIATALSARALGAERQDQLRQMIENADRIVAVCGWLNDALAANGAPAHKLRLSRQGIAPALLNAAHTAAAARVEPSGPLRLLYLGRWHPVKGIDVLVRAVRSANADVSLTVRAVRNSAEERAYEDEVRALAGGDPRISFETPVPRNGLAAVLARYDALAVPSVGLETGPLVVLEAQAAGLFVLGSRLGGIAELVEDGDTGALVEAGNVRAWARSIERLAELHAGGGLPRRPRNVRTMAAAAAEMADLYRSL